MRVIFFDTETTGLLKTNASNVSEQPYIIEFYGATYDINGKEWSKVDEYETFIKPPIPISQEITKITGIDDKTVSNSPSFLDVYDDLCNLFISTRRMVGHNLSFDTSMLANELVRIDRLINFPWPIEHVCTVEKSLPVEGYRLNLKKAYGLATKGGVFSAHRAKNDVEAMIEVYKWLMEKKLIT